MLSLKEEKKKIGKEFHPFHKDTLSLPFYLRSFRKHYEVQAKKIIKYAPRYMESLQIRPFRDWKLLNALKMIKKIRSITNSPSDRLKRWRLALKNKLKSVEEFQLRGDQWRPLEKYKAFPKLTKLVLIGEASFLLGLLRYMPGLTSLKSLLIEIDDETPLDLLKKLNSMSRILNSLKKLEIRWISSTDSKEGILFSSFVENTNILRSLTHLLLYQVAGDEFPKAFERLTQNSNGLVFLLLSLLQDDKGFLSLLKDFPNLKAVEIIPSDPVSFFKNFTLPPSIKEVKILLSEYAQSPNEGLISVKEWPRLLTQSLEDLYANNQKIASFCEKWSGLCNLTSLEISFSLAPGAISLTLPLMNLILETIPSLVDFNFEVNPWKYRESDPKIYPIDLTSLFGALHRFRSTLQKIQLKFPCSDLVIGPSKQDMAFSRLTVFSLSLHTIQDHLSVKNVFSAFERSYSLETGDISLGEYTVNSNRALLDLLQVLQKPPRNSKISFKIQIEKLDFDTFDRVFKEFIEKAKRTPAVLNVYLDIKILNMYYFTGIKALAFLKEMFKSVWF